MTVYVIRAKVLALKEHKSIVKSWKEGDEVKTQEENLGWAVQMEGSREALFLGMEKPEGFEVGKTIKITLAPEEEQTKKNPDEG